MDAQRQQDRTLSDEACMRGEQFRTAIASASLAAKRHDWDEAFYWLDGARLFLDAMRQEVARADS